MLRSLTSSYGTILGTPSYWSLSSLSSFDRGAFDDGLGITGCTGRGVPSVCDFDLGARDEGLRERFTDCCFGLLSFTPSMLSLLASGLDFDF